MTFCPQAVQPHGFAHFHRELRSCEGSAEASCELFDYLRLSFGRACYTLIWNDCDICLADADSDFLANTSNRRFVSLLRVFLSNIAAISQRSLRNINLVSTKLVPSQANRIAMELWVNRGYCRRYPVQPTRVLPKPQQVSCPQ